MTPSRLRIRVSGRVQGVGYRAWARRVAREQGVAGTVRNLADGTVEVRASGDAAALDEFGEWLRRGPDGARVDRVEALEVEDEGEAYAGAFRIAEE